MRNWVVVLDKVPEGDFPYSDKFFPRGFHYKTDAGLLKASIDLHGGAARILTGKEFDGEIKSGDKA